MMDMLGTPDEIFAAAGGRTEHRKQYSANMNGHAPADEPADAPADAKANWRLLNPVDWAGREPAPREWVVEEWLPIGAVTGLYGDGGIGKTLLAQQLQYATAMAKPWCGLAVRPCRSIGLYCEDDADELHRRQIRICEAFGTVIGELEGMRLISGVGCDNSLMDEVEYGKAKSTPNLAELRRIAKDHHAELVVLDTAADLFNGDENNRRMVRQFVTELNAMAHELRCAVLLNAHPSRAGIKSGDLDGGSTAWSNSFRSRWSLARPKSDSEGGAEAGEGLKSPDRELVRRKANYASTGDVISLRFISGVLLPPRNARELIDGIGRPNVDQVFLDLLAQTSLSNRTLSDSRNASNSAAKTFASMPGSAGYTRKEFERAQERLFAAGKIRMEEYGRVSGRGAKPRHMVAVEASKDV